MTPYETTIQPCFTCGYQDGYRTYRLNQNFEAICSNCGTPADLSILARKDEKYRLSMNTHRD